MAVSSGQHLGKERNESIIEKKIEKNREETLRKFRHHGAKGATAFLVFLERRKAQP